MPLYDYRCRKCEYEFEDVRTIAERYGISCPVCESSDIGIIPGTGKEKNRFFPAGYWEHISLTGEHISSVRQLREACKKNNCYAVYDDGYLGVK